MSVQLTMERAQGLLKSGYTTWSSSMTPWVVHVGTSFVGAFSPGKHAAILVKRPGCWDLLRGFPSLTSHQNQH